LRFLSWEFLLVLICILAINACGGLAQGKNGQATDPMNSGIAHKDYSKLISKAQAAGSVRVIVKLNMPFVPEGQLSTPREAIDQQVQISVMQDQLCEALSTYSVKGIKRFKYIPYIAMEVDSIALKVLISNPLVKSFEEDAPVPPTLNRVSDPGYSQSSFEASIGGYYPERI